MVSLFYIFSLLCLSCNDRNSLDREQKPLDSFLLYYPTSRLSIIDKGKGMFEGGIQPYIQEDIDIDLKLALQLLQNEEW
jgi:hypothetical protein